MYLIFGGVIILLILISLFFYGMFRLVLEDFKFANNKVEEKVEEINKLNQIPPKIIHIQPDVIKVRSQVQVIKILNEEQREEVARQLYYELASKLWKDKLLKTSIQQNEEDYTIQTEIKILKE